MKRIAAVWGLLAILYSHSFCQSGFIEAGKAKLYYEMKGEGTPLILLHAGMLDKRMWAGQFDEFAKHFKVIMFDARLHGMSTSEPETYSHQEDLNILMTKLGINKAVILGLSQGGYVAIDFALAYPDKVIALIPVAAGLTGYDFTDKYTKDNEAKMKDVKSLEEAIEIIQRTWTDGPQRTPDKIDQGVREKAKQWYTENAAKINPEVIEKRLDPPAVKRLNSINVPVLSIVGELDITGILEISDMIVRDVKGAKKLVVKGVGHLINMEKPAEFNKAVIEFVSGLSK